jgi:hypothetical protein
VFVDIETVPPEGIETGKLERIMFDTAIEEVPAAFVAVANALK